MHLPLGMSHWPFARHVVLTVPLKFLWQVALQVLPGAEMLPQEKLVLGCCGGLPMQAASRTAHNVVVSSCKLLHFNHDMRSAYAMPRSLNRMQV